MSVRPYSQKVADGWSADMSVRARAASLGWIGPFSADEYSLLAAGCDEAALYTPGAEPLSRARRALREKHADALHKARERVAERQAEWDTVLTEAMRQAVAKGATVAMIDEDNPGWQRTRRALEEQINILADLNSEFSAADRRLLRDESRAAR